MIPPRALIYVGILVGLTGLIPLALVYKARFNHSEMPRVHFVWHMDNQERFKAQQENPFFEDGRASRLPEAGTVARVAAGEPSLDDAAFYAGLIDENRPAEAGNFVERIPVSALPGGVMTREFVERGRQRYDIYCAVCHDDTGGGQGMVHKRVQLRRIQGAMKDSWTAPAVLYTDLIRAQPDGQLFRTISYGKFTVIEGTTKLKHTMPGYAAQIPTHDRWAIVAYVRSLQVAGSAKLSSLSDAEQAQLGTARQELAAAAAAKLKAEEDNRREAAEVFRAREELKKQGTQNGNGPK